VAVVTGHPVAAGRERLGHRPPATARGSRDQYRPPVHTRILPYGVRVPDRQGGSAPGARHSMR